MHKHPKLVQLLGVKSEVFTLLCLKTLFLLDNYYATIQSLRGLPSTS